MSPISASASAKVRRAEEHFDHLRGEVQRRLGPKTYRIRPESNSDQTEHRFYVEFDPRALPRLGLILGDGIHCLRSALDHTVYAIGVKESGMDPPPRARELQFPITEDEVGWAKNRWHVGSLDPEVQTAIKRLQPHSAADEFALTALGGLEQLDVADKHRIVPVVAVFPTLTAADLSGLPPGGVCTFDYGVKPLKDDAPLLTVTTDRPAPNMKMRPSLTLQPGLTRIRGNGVETTILVWDGIDRMRLAVNAVIDELSRFC